MKLLVIEDDPDLAANLVDHLSQRGHFVDAAADGKTGLHLAATENFDAIVLDLILPALDGLELLRRLREDVGRATPVLVLSARDTVEDRIAGLTAGADDYLVKPFALAELEVRLLALVRRARSLVGQGRLKVADLVFDAASRRVARGKRVIELAPIPLKILETLMRASPRVVRRGELERLLWGGAPPPSDALRSHLHQLRQAIEQTGEPTLLETVRGVGWRLVAPDDVPTV
ncbi:MAG: response regulator transcription factor [Rhodocyclaceae bacterium]